MIAALRAHGQLLVVDQPSASGALPRSVVCGAGMAEGCRPGLATPAGRPSAPGETQACTRAAAIIAEAGRTMPQTTPPQGRQR